MVKIKKYILPNDLTKFVKEYFDFCEFAYPKSSFNNNFTKLIAKLPLDVAKI